MLSADSPGESKSIVEFSLTLSNGLASLVSHDLSNIISVFADKGVPFQQPLSSGPWVDLAIRFESCLSCLDGLVYIFGSIVRGSSPSLASARICTRIFSGLSIDGITEVR